MFSKVSIPLDIPDVQVLDIETNKRGDYVITVESSLNSAICQRCGREISKFHSHDRTITLRHLPILGHAVYIRLRPKRYECPHCSSKHHRKTSTQRLSWYRPKSPHTKAYEEQVLLQLINSTIQDVTLKEKLGYEAVVGIIKRSVTPRVEWGTFDRLDVIGLDEIALKKGHSDYVVIVTARLRDDQVKVLAVLPNREKATVKAFLERIPTRLQRTIHTVCSDMWKAYINAAKEVLGAAVVVVDRYHVAQKYRAGADKLRKQELKRLKRDLSDDEYKTIKGAMWPFRKNKAALKPHETELLERLFAYCPSLKLAYDFREKLTAIFEKDLTKTQATDAIKAWRQAVETSALTCFDPFLTTLDTYLDEITNYFLHRDSSGFVEGLNNKIKVLKRRCYGLLNLDHLFQRLFLDLEGYALFA
ncbi:MAG: ISL3 family transposase [Anaerolineae bacterium]|nr:ISL3 family transposase [Anaerolineae bacterium]